ncbi:uncharacterized protein J3D65DRAFT_616426, partial [Phyllosticta citribraziliensis]
MVSNEEADDSSLERVNEASPQRNAEGNLLSSKRSNIETSGSEASRPLCRQLPSFGSLSGMVISSSLQFDLPVLANTSVALLETDPSRSYSSPSTYDVDSADASSETRPNHESSSTTKFESEYAADDSSEIYHHHEISSATEFNSEFSPDASTACETDSHHDADFHANKVDTAPKVRIPMVERSEICLFSLSGISTNSISMGSEDAAVDDYEDGRYYGYCRGYDFSDSLVVLEDDNVRIGNLEEAEELDEEFVKAWRARHGYN